MWLEKIESSKKTWSIIGGRINRLSRNRKNKVQMLISSLNEYFCLKDMNTSDDFREPLQYRNERKLIDDYSKIKVKLPNGTSVCVSLSMCNFASRIAELINKEDFIGK